MTAARDRRDFLRALLAGVGSLVLGPALAACDVREFARRHGAKLRLSIATGPAGGVYFTYGGGLAKLISSHVANVEATAEVTSASVDNLKFLRDGKADLAFTTADTLDDAYKGAGAFARFGRVPANALAQLYPNLMHLVTLADRGIDGVRGLRGRVVAFGGAGSGTAALAERILRVEGLDAARDVRRQHLGVAPAVEALRDGKIDAFFWGSGVPSGPILDLATSAGSRMRLVENAHVLQRLRERYGAALYDEIVIPRAAYPGQHADVHVVAVANILAVDWSMGEPLAYEITRALHEHRSELVAIHPEAERLTLESACRGSPVPFHPGAIRYYREAGVWRG